ncbi:polysaccharide deacetylase family protein [Helicobacter bizzozeronii]|uniref:polysaccharide deacetylase family protein n=1 Tax=Helicobacter bizzozeronii TaxID=56877 RepID=UPI001F43073A|nr:polysaccharide deacetylase family protein [Helicobacter bizzozeronii]
MSPPPPPPPQLATTEFLSPRIDSSKLPKRPVLLTFDDGYIDHFTVVFPLLKQHGLQGSFFVPGKTITENTLLDVNKIHFILASADVNDLLGSLLERMDFYRGQEFQYADNKTLWHNYAKEGRFDAKEVVFIKRMLQSVLPEELRHMISSELFAKYLGLAEDKFARELYMNHDQIRLMKDAGMFIGFHGYDHYWLTSLSEEEIKTDIQKGLEVISPYIDKDAWVACYPFGDHNQLVRDYCKNNGCMLGVTIEVSFVDYHRHDPLLLPRLDCNDFPPRSEKYRNIGGLV